MAKIKHVVRRLCPPFLVSRLSRVKSALDDKRRRKMAVKEIFTEIYDKELWGNGTEKFCSGLGSAKESVVQPYIKKISSFLETYKIKKPRIVDLGCGDFEVGKHFIKFCSEYTGVDVVPRLIRELNKTRATKSVKFLCLDIIASKLPDGDVVFLRQVLQHLSNKQILKILPKLKKYKTVFITEHYPTPNPKIKPNKDIVPGSAIRVYKNSGVYLEQAPFNVPKSTLELFLEAPGAGMGEGLDQGVIRTYKLNWPANK